VSEGSRQYRLQELGIPRLLFALLRSRFTGTLTIPQSVPEPGMRTIWFRGGMPIFTDWISPPDVLGEVLLAKAMLSPAAYQDGLVAMAREGGLLGQVLVRAGVLDRRSLAEALRTQCTRKLVHAFMLRDPRRWRASRWARTCGRIWRTACITSGRSAWSRSRACR
jgi:hypothetical protein